FGELDLPEPRESAHLRDAAGRSGVGGTSFGELDLGESNGGDDMEFADIPQRERASLPPQVAPPRVAVDTRKSEKSEKKAAGQPKKSRAAAIAAILVVIVLAAGAGLGFTPYGYFGMYFFDQFMPGAGDP